MSAVALISRVRRLQEMQAKLAAAASLSKKKQRPPSTDGIVSFLRDVSPHLESPECFAPYIAKLEDGVKGGHELVFAAPPQHGKSTVTTHGLVWALIKHPKRRFGYATYNLERAISVARSFRTIAQAAGLELSGTLGHAYNSQGGGVLFAGRGTAVTGEPIDGFGVVDDPFKDRSEAESRTIRDTADDWHREVWLTRHHPGTSSFVMATRWHEDDLSGRLIRRGWEYLNLEAVAGNNDPLGRRPGEPLCPSRWPLDALEKQRARVGEYGWASLFCGRPRPRGGKLFQDAHYYDIPPRSGYRIGHGIDLAYSKKTQADYSVSVVLLEQGGIYYVANVVRKQARAPEFAQDLKRICGQYPGKPRWYCAGPEKGVADLIGGIDTLAASSDKYVRAQPVSAAWNEGKVLVPSDASWVNDFISEVCDFTGVNDSHDDQVDALAAAFDSLQTIQAEFDSSFMQRSTW